jgi:membrane fusion protein (multidrug efflux system)
MQKQEYNIKLYQDQEQRQRTLLEKEYISRQQEYEQSNNVLLTARADLPLPGNLQSLRARAVRWYLHRLRTLRWAYRVAVGTAITTLSRVQPQKVDLVPSRLRNRCGGDPVLVTDEATLPDSGQSVRHQPAD